MSINECEGIKESIKSTENLDEMLVQICEVIKKDLKGLCKHIFGLKSRSLPLNAQLNSAIINISEYTSADYESDVYNFCKAIALEALYKAYSEWCVNSLVQLPSNAYDDLEYNEIKNELLKFNYKSLIDDLRKIGKLDDENQKEKEYPEDAETFFSVLSLYICAIRIKDHSDRKVRIAIELIPAFLILLLTTKKKLLFKGPLNDGAYKANALNVLKPPKRKLITLRKSIKPKNKIIINADGKFGKTPTKPLPETISCNALEETLEILRHIDDIEKYSYKLNGYCATVKNMIDAKAALEGEHIKAARYNATLNVYYLKLTSTLMSHIIRRYLLKEVYEENRYAFCSDFYIVLDSLLNQSIISAHPYQNNIRQCDLQQIDHYVCNLSEIFKEIDFNVINVGSIDPLKPAMLELLDACDEDFKKQSKLIIDKKVIAAEYKKCYQSIENSVAALAHTLENYKLLVTHDTFLENAIDKFLIQTAKYRLTRINHKLPQ